VNLKTKPAPHACYLWVGFSDPQRKKDALKYWPSSVSAFDKSLKGDHASHVNSSCYWNGHTFLRPDLSGRPRLRYDTYVGPVAHWTLGKRG